MLGGTLKARPAVYAVWIVFQPADGPHVPVFPRRNSLRPRTRESFFGIINAASNISPDQKGIFGHAAEAGVPQHARGGPDLSDPAAAFGRCVGGARMASAAWW